MRRTNFVGDITNNRIESTHIKGEAVYSEHTFTWRCASGSDAVDFQPCASLASVAAATDEASN